jgi:LPXTG-motif cell wall-anchored protein
MKKLSYQIVSKASLFTLFVPLLFAGSIALAEEDTTSVVDTTTEELVEQKTSTPTALKLSTHALTITLNETQQIQATVSPEDADNQQISWTSTNEQVASVTNGLVEGIKAGTTTITATVNGITETVQVTVTDPVIELTDQQSTIRVSGATSVLTKEATLKVETMKENTEIYKRVKEATNGQFLLVDIQLLNKLGESMQPNGTVKVQLPIPKDYQQEKVTVYTYDDKMNKLTEVKGSVEGTAYTFETTHFSYYALVEEVDTQALTEAIQKATALSQADYTKDSWTIVTNALGVAQDVVENAQSQATVDQATNDLNQALNRLERKPDKAALQQAVTKGQKLKKDNYQASSWQTFQEKLTQAATVLTDERATKQEIEQALKHLQAAQNNLKTQDKTTLVTAINQAEELVKKDYTEKTWTTVVDALKQAKKVATDENATQTAINEATETLNTAIKKLENKDTSSKTEKQKLTEAIKKAEKLVEEHYTEETWKVFSEKLATAKKVAADINATQQKIDKALKELTTAQKDLIAAIDKEALGDLIDKALKLKASDFDTKTWANLQNSLEEAQAIFGDAKATVNDIAESFKKLKADIAALKAARNTNTSNRARNNLTRTSSTNRRTSTFRLPKRTSTTDPTTYRKHSFLPRTGEQFSAYLPIIGGVLIVAGVIVYIRRRKNKTN